MSQAQSGLSSVKRNWSNATVAPASSSSQLIEDWGPTPPKKPKLTPEEAEKRRKRILAIKEALAPKCHAPARPQPSVPQPLTHCRSGVSVPNPSPRVSSTSKPNKMAKLFLSQEQTHILKLVHDGQSLFYTGSAGSWCSSVGAARGHDWILGTGKSVLLKEIISTLKKSYPKNPEAVAITASTGQFPNFSHWYQGLTALTRYCRMQHWWHHDTFICRNRLRC